MPMIWKHFATQKVGGHALSFAQQGRSFVLAAPFIIEAQSSRGADAESEVCPPASQCTTAPTAFAAPTTLAHADAIGARTIATTTSAETIERSKDKDRTPRDQMSEFGIEWSRQIAVSPLSLGRKN